MHNPLRSEAEMFRLVVIVGVAAAVVIAVALDHRPARRGDRPRRRDRARRLAALAPVAREPPEDGRGRAQRRRRPPRPRGRQRDRRRPGAARGDQHRAGRGAREIMVVVPALTSSALEHWSSDVDGALADARARLDDSLAAMRAGGLNASGHVGDHHEPDGGDRGRAARVRRRRADHLHPSARALDAGSRAASSSAPAARCRCRSRTWSSTSRPSAAEVAVAASCSPCSAGRPRR